MIQPKTLINLAQQKEFSIGPYQIISQEPRVISQANLRASAVSYLPQFILFWHDLEKVSGHRWKNTSYIRNSPSHQLGQAFDLAPDIATTSQSQYAVYNNSDPVLYKRERLIRQLQQLARRDYSGDGSNALGVFIEPDHLHLQILAPNGGNKVPTPIVKWKIAKPIYPDTYDRMQLPLIKT